MGVRRTPTRMRIIGRNWEESKKRLWAEEDCLPRGRRDEVGTEEIPALARDAPGGSGPSLELPTAAMMKRRTTSIRATKTLYTAIYPQHLCDEHGERLARQVGAMQRGAKARLLSGTANPHASNPCDAIRSGQHIRTITLCTGPCFSSSHLRRYRRAGRSRRVGVAVFAGNGVFNAESAEEGERARRDCEEEVAVFAGKGTSPPAPLRAGRGEIAPLRAGRGEIAVAVFAGIADSAGRSIAVFAGIADSRRGAGAGERV